jgi:hypothetical protein
MTSALNDNSNEQKIHLDECRTQNADKRPSTEDQKKRKHNQYLILQMTIKKAC